MNPKKLFLTVTSTLLLIASWVVSVIAFFMYIALHIAEGEVKHPTSRVWLQMLRSFFENHYFLFWFLFFLINLLVFVRMISKGKNIEIYKVLFYSAFLNFAFGLAGLFFQLGGHGQEVDGFEWITVFGTFGTLLVVWYMQANLLFLNKKS